MEQDHRTSAVLKAKTAFENKYSIKGSIAEKMLKRFLPIMILTNLSSLLLITVDGIVAGNLINPEAFNAISIITPVERVVGAMTMLFSTGVSISMSLSLGRADPTDIRRNKHAAFVMSFCGPLLCMLAQIPLAFILIRSCNLSPETARLVREYLLGFLIATPFGVLSTIGVGLFQILGKMKVLMVLTAIEGCVNLIFDLLFVGVFHWGIAGAGFGTLAANIVRATITFVYLFVKTDIYRSKGERCTKTEIRSIFSHGLPDTLNMSMIAVQNYCIVRIIIHFAGEQYNVISGVCAFTLGLCMVFTNGVLGSMRPLLGLYSGAAFTKPLRILIRKCRVSFTILSLSIITVMLLFPSIFFSLYGLTAYPDGSFFALRLYAFSLLLKGHNGIYRAYFANRGETKFTSILTVAGNCLLPIFAFLLSITMPWYWIWLAYALNELVLLLFNFIKHARITGRDKETEKKDLGLLFLTIKPDQAIEASRYIRRYGEEIGAEERVSYRMALCVEEMVAYAVASQKREDVSIEVLIHYLKDGGKFVMLDDGERTGLNEDPEVHELTISNYTLLKKLSKDVKYQYLLKLNYTEFQF